MEQHNEQQQQVRTTGRIKKPKAVFDPSDNYLPRAQRLSIATPPVGAGGGTVGGSHQIQERRSTHSRMSTASSSDSTTVSVSMSKEVCVGCGKRESKRPAFAFKNPLISCAECENKIHKLCLKVDFDDFEKVRQNYKCEKCSPCSICNKRGNGNGDNNETIAVICSTCASLYHNECLQSRVLKAGYDQPRDWICTKCSLDQQEKVDVDILPVKKIREIIGGGHVPPVAVNNKTIQSASTTESNATKRTHGDAQTKEYTSLDEEEATEEKRSKIDNSVVTDGNIDSQSLKSHSLSVENNRNSPNNISCEDIPDVQLVKNWSVDKVYEYFCKQFPKEAYIFKDEEIDGRSLLLLKRSDVVKKLPLKLGPSLRLYSAILKIQAQSNDNTLGWNCTL
ncbi:polyhomeotic-like protein 2 [Musca vetustissima]|uniref:polyhomeotic-like protein 2 n=1 Tax=Musca vetustissima TaxID=27455 RepID=UPI002AB65BA3|nr:polyhomeotic-like protein 2 [Musca vetustissima]